MPEHSCTVLCVTEGIEALEGVANKRQAEVGVIGLASSFSRSAHLRRRVDLRNLVDGEVLRVDGAGKLRLERRTDLAKAIPVDTAEEWVLLEFCGATHVTETVLRIADETTIVSNN
jgi:hypothetical protein